MRGGSAAPTALRPSLRGFVESPLGRRWLASVGLAVLAALVSCALHPATRPLIGLLAVTLVVMFVAVVVLYRARARVWIYDDRVVWRKLVNRGCFSLAEVKAAKYDPLQPFFVVGDHQNRPLLRLHTALWTPGALRALLSFSEGSTRGD